MEMTQTKISIKPYYLIFVLLLFFPCIMKSSGKMKEKLPTNKKFIVGKFNYKIDSNFIKVSPIHANKVVYLNKSTYKAFRRMYNDAQKVGIRLIIFSGTRSFYEQKRIWERKWNTYSGLDSMERVQKVLQYSAMPMTSRHHWGTDIDLNSLENIYFEKGKGKILYNWLLSNAYKYGFYQVYTTQKNGRTGYNEEKWHWSYLPLASKYLDFYNEHISYEDITGFKGSTLAKKVKIIEEYVNGISEK